MQKRYTQLSNSDILSESSQLDDEQRELESKYTFERSLVKYTKNQYKKTISYIDSIISLDEHTSYYWQILYIKLCSYQQIIEKKFLKYYDSDEINRIEKYLTKFNKELQNFIKIIKIKPNQDINVDFSIRYECLITLILKQCLNYAKFCIYQKLIFDCIGFLGLAERLIKNTSDFFISPETFNIISSIYLFLSSLYIISENYETAKRYLILCLKISYKELELRLGDNYRNQIINLSQKDLDEENIEKIFLNLTISFYHLGVCNENEYDFEAAYQAYKQAKWFGKVIPNDEMIEFLVTIYNMEKRELLRYQMFDFFKSEADKIYDEPKKVEKKPKFYYDEESKIKKFEKLQNFIENLKIPEIDDDEPDLLNKVVGKPYSQKVGIPTKTIRVLNYLMEDKFNDVIYKMKKLEINRLNNKTKETILKQITRMKNDERALIEEKKKEKEKKKLILQNYEILSNNNTNVFNDKDIELIDIKLHTKNKKNKRPPSTKLRLNTNDFLNKKQNKILFSTNINNINQSTEYSNYSSINHKKCNTLNIDNSTIYNTKVSKSKKSKNKPQNEKKKKEEIEKINYDLYVFNKKFRKKQDFLNKQFSRECKFQKELLACKAIVIQDNVEPFNKRKTISQCENFFTNTLKQEIKLAKERELLKDEQNKKTKTDLDSLKVIKYIPGLSDIIQKASIKKKKKKSLSPKSQNMKFIDDLTSKIEEIDNLKGVLRSSYNRELKRERHKSARINFKK